MEVGDAQLSFLTELLALNECRRAFIKRDLVQVEIEGFQFAQGTNVEGSSSSVALKVAVL